MAFALKILTKGPDFITKNFDKEVSALRKMGRGSYTVELYAAYQIGEEYALLFPWAAGGNLSDLWKTPPKELYQKALPRAKPNASSSHETSDPKAFIKWIAQQCLGLAQGLQHMHGHESLDPLGTLSIWGRHGDVKPENILYFSQETDNESPLGKLKLGDFGLAEFHRRVTQSRVGDPGPRTQAYRAPEYDFRTPRLNSKVDIWALGCVFSELLTWVIRGCDSVEFFANQRFEEPSGKYKGDDYFVKVKKSMMRRLGNSIKEVACGPDEQGERRTFKLKRSVQNVSTSK